MNPNIKETLILFAEVIVPELEKKKSLQHAFLKNFKKLYYGIEATSLQKIKLLIKLIDKLGYILAFQKFTHMPLEKRKIFVNRLFKLPFGKISGGLTGLRSLILIAYYGIEDVWEEIGYDGPANAHLK